MAKLSRDFDGTTLHPREDLYVTAALASLNAETIISVDGSSTLSLDIRGTFVGTIEVSGTVDGTNWVLIPVRPINVASKLWLTAVTTAGTWFANCAGYRKVRARMTAWTSGSATVYLSASVAGFASDNELLTTSVITAVGAASAAVTCTLPAPGAGLRQYLTYLSINRFASVLLTAAAAPVTVTTTNLPGTVAFSFAADAAAIGTMDRWREDFAYPIASSAQNVATTIVAPVTTGVIWRITAGYYIAP